VRTARRPPGWIAPGPPARPPAELAPLWPAGDEDLCWLSGDWRLLQRTDGHRWSLDDLVTAWLAHAACARPPRSALDLGCGIGTVLLLTAWRFPEARCVGIEAQDVSVDLARRSIAWNGAGDRCEVRHADFREPGVLSDDERFELVTGTPPYFAPGAGTESDRVQRAPCRFEHRGGVEDYCRAAARALAPGAPFVACEAAGQEPRVRAAAAAHGLAIERWRDVVPRAGKPPLISLFVMRRAAEAGPRRDEAPLVVRDAGGRRTPEMLAIRRDLGMPH
jgi:tRNA1(Val) A37 N6-methylase TrmN6